MHGGEDQRVIGPADVLYELGLTAERNLPAAQALRRRGEKDLTKPRQTFLGLGPARARLPAIEPLVVTRCVDHWMAKSVEPIASTAIHLIGARTPEDVADADDRAQVMRVEILEHQSEPGLLQRVVRRVSHHANGEAARRILRGWVQASVEKRDDDEQEQGAEAADPLFHVQEDALARFVGVLARHRRERGRIEANAWQSASVERRRNRGTIHPRRAELLERLIGAATDRDIGILDGTDARIECGLRQVPHVRRRVHPGQAGLVEPLVAPPVRHGDDGQAAAPHPLLLVEQLRQLAHGHAVPHGHGRKIGDEAAGLVRPGDLRFASRSPGWPIEHDDGDSLFLRFAASSIT